jgi:hypothetical protein
MDVNDNALILDERGVLETIASKLAPTGYRFIQNKRVIVSAHRESKNLTSRLFTRDNVAPVQ